MQKAFITGVSGTALTEAEGAFLAAERPAGVILFARNCDSAEQITALTASVRACVGTDRTLIVIDQEGGRVQRLRPPISRLLPAAARYGALYAKDPSAGLAAARLIARQTAADLTALGITANCAPVLDVPVPGAHDIIGDRAYGRVPATIIALGRAVAQGLMDGGVLPIMKHIPGHGRATADSHLELPVVTASIEELASDFEPFTALSSLPAAMTAHVVYTNLDPKHPASTSRPVHDLMRRKIGFAGLLMSDDLSMKALSGPFAERTQAVLQAGSDLALHCNGDLAEMREVAAAARLLAGEALARFDRALAVTRSPAQSFDEGAAQATLSRLIGDFA